MCFASFRAAGDLRGHFGRPGTRLGVRRLDADRREGERLLLHPKHLQFQHLRPAKRRP